MSYCMKGNDRSGEIVESFHQIRFAISHLTNEFEISDESNNFDKFDKIASTIPTLIDEIKQMIDKFQLLLDLNITHYAMSKSTNADYSKLFDELQKQYPVTPTTPLTNDYNSNLPNINYNKIVISQSRPKIHIQISSLIRFITYYFNLIYYIIILCNTIFGIFIISIYYK